MPSLLESRLPALVDLFGDTGTDASYECLLYVVGQLSLEELDGLEDDLQFFEMTGLVGIHMSRLVFSLCELSQADAA